MTGTSDDRNPPRGFRGFDALISDVELPDSGVSARADLSEPIAPPTDGSSTHPAPTLRADDRPVPYRPPRSNTRRRRNFALAGLAVLLVAGGLVATDAVPREWTQSDWWAPAEWWKRLSTQMAARPDASPTVPPSGSRLSSATSGPAVSAPPGIAPPTVDAGRHAGAPDRRQDANPFADLIPGARWTTPLDRSGSALVVEEMPPVGVGLTLVDSQLRYCVAQRMRIEGADAALDTRSAIAVDRFNAAVADYNSRCSNYRYRQGALERVRQEMAARRTALEAEGIRSILGALR